MKREAANERRTSFCKFQRWRSECKWSRHALARASDASAGRGRTTCRHCVRMWNTVSYGPTHDTVGARSRTLFEAKSLEGEWKLKSDGFVLSQAKQKNRRTRLDSKKKRWVKLTFQTGSKRKWRQAPDKFEWRQNWNLVQKTMRAPETRATKGKVNRVEQMISTSCMRWLVRAADWRVLNWN